MFLPNTCSVRKPTFSEFPVWGSLVCISQICGGRRLWHVQEVGTSVCGCSFNSYGIVAMIWVVCYSGQLVPVHAFLLPRNSEPFCWVFCLLGFRHYAVLPTVTWQDAFQQYPGQPRVLWLLCHYVVCTQVQKPPFRDRLHPSLLSFTQFLCRGRQVSAPPVSLSLCMSLCLFLSASLFSSATPVPGDWPSPSTPLFPFSFS